MTIGLGLLLVIWVAACDDARTGIVGADDEEAISLVAEGFFELYPEDVIGAAAACYFDSTAWASLISEDGSNYVNLKGYGIDNQKTVAMLQFRVFRSPATFAMNAMELNGVAQPDSVVLDLVARMVAC
jgi:hypothetical protein